MKQSDFYFMNDPVAISDANTIRYFNIMDKMKYLKDRLSTIQYKSFGNEDKFQSPTEMFSNGNFDCEDGVGYVATVFRLTGVPHTVNIGKVSGIPYYHTWITLNIDGEEWLFETTAPDYLPMRKATVHYVPLWKWEG